MVDFTVIHNVLIIYKFSYVFREYVELDFFRDCGEPIIFYSVRISRKNYYIAIGERHFHAHNPGPIIFRSFLLKWDLLLGETGTNTGTGTDTGTNFWKYTGTGTGTGTNFLK